MQPLREVTTNFEHGGHRVLLMTLLLLIVVSPFVQQYVGVRRFLAVFMTLVLLAAVRTVANQARQYHIALVLGVLALVSQFGVLIMNLAWLETVRYTAMMLFLFWVCGLLLRDIILRSQSVTLELILGAINVYLMVGVAFAFMFGLIEHLQHGSFAGLAEQMNAPDSILNFVYFSFITLTTLGYGDITPLTPYATTASFTEAVFGQLYLAILVARLVGLYIARRGEPG